MTETEHERKVVEYWAKTRRFSIYDIGSNFKNTDDLTLPYEPTAVLTSPNPKQRKFRLSDIVNLDFSR
jgi:hypothetical protein